MEEVGTSKGINLPPNTCLIKLTILTYVYTMPNEMSKGRHRRNLLAVTDDEEDSGAGAGGGVEEWGPGAGERTARWLWLVTLQLAWPGLACNERWSLLLHIQWFKQMAILTKSNKSTSLYMKRSRMLQVVRSIQNCVRGSSSAAQWPEYFQKEIGPCSFRCQYPWRKIFSILVFTVLGQEDTTTDFLSQDMVTTTEHRTHKKRAWRKMRRSMT